MKTCSACGSKYRTGVVATVMLDGRAKSACVCQSCAKDGMLLVAARHSVPKPVVSGYSATKLKAALQAKIRLMEKMSKAASNETDKAFVEGALSGIRAAILELESSC